jgi:hypothetical protein
VSVPYRVVAEGLSRICLDLRYLGLRCPRYPPRDHGGASSTTPEWYSGIFAGLDLDSVITESKDAIQSNEAGIRVA